MLYVRRLLLTASLNNPYRDAKKPLTGEPGFEPGLTDPESVVLPLHHSPVSVEIYFLFAYYADLSDVTVAKGDNRQIKHNLQHKPRFCKIIKDNSTTTVAARAA